MAIRGSDVLLDVLRSEGVRHVFGNPGSTELPFVDALAAADDLSYVLALQEATAVGMADGYAQATGRPAFLNLHTSAGVGNAIGNLTNAQANGTPLVVTAGQQDLKHIVAEPLLSGDLVGLARAVSKWAHEVRTPGELGTVLRRAFADAPSPPAGPVFVSIPMDHLEAEVDGGAPPRSQIRRDAVAGGLDELADLLTSTHPDRLLIVAGDEVASSGGVGALVALAEALGARVSGMPLHATTVFPTAHPLWAGPLAPAATAIAGTLARYERVFVVAGQAFLVYPYTPGPAVPADVELLHLAPAHGQPGRTWPVRLGLVGDVGASLEALLPLVLARVDVAAAANALDEARAARAASDDEREAGVLARYDTVPMHPAAAAHALVRSLPSGVPVVDEAITTGTYVRAALRTTAPGSYFFCKGGGLGWGMPAACGVSLGRDRSPVLCVVGDGSSMYSPQALWTAARERLPVVFAVVDNGQYLILKNNLRAMQGESVRRNRFVAMDLDDPHVDHLALARSMGVAATRVESAHDVGDAVRAAFGSGAPHLLHLPITTP